ncbi:hypothetical protein FOCC_FOCC017341 [Frankliniella occidentalis]|nr:hypothetical protein FOCC_FOCC017341 [Frankliniella occidentalis]
MPFTARPGALKAPTAAQRPAPRGSEVRRRAVKTPADARPSPPPRAPAPPPPYNGPGDAGRRHPAAAGPAGPTDQATQSQVGRAARAGAAAVPVHVHGLLSARQPERGHRRHGGPHGQRQPRLPGVFVAQKDAGLPAVVVLLGLPGDADPGLAAGAALRRALLPGRLHGGHGALHHAAARGGHVRRLARGGRDPRGLGPLSGLCVSLLLRSARQVGAAPGAREIHRLCHRSSAARPRRHATRDGDPVVLGGRLAERLLLLRGARTPRRHPGVRLRG